MIQLSRRKFLGQSVLATSLAPLALASLTSPFVRSVRAGEPVPNEKVRLGLIGCGGMGQGDLECFFLNPEVDCVVVCDVDDARLAKGVEICEKKRGKKPETVKDFRRVLDRKDMDVVLIATPDHWHACRPSWPARPARMSMSRSRSPKPLTKAAPCSKPPSATTASCRWAHNGAVASTSSRPASSSAPANSARSALVRGWAYLDWLPSIGKPAGLRRRRRG